MGLHPVVQPSQYRLRLRWRDQTADEDNLDNREHSDHERDGSGDCATIAAPVAAMIASAIGTWAGEYRIPIHNVTHNDPFSHEL
jgi:hypothetical protein